MPYEYIPYNNFCITKICGTILFMFKKVYYMYLRFKNKKLITAT